MTKNELNLLLDALHTGVVEILFKKKNGENRLLECTLNQKLIPGEYTEKENEEDYQPTVIPIYCPDIKEWRSFIVENVISWNKI